KKFFKMLVTSNTYKQATITTQEKRDKDPHNRFLSRGPRYRMDAEMLRDNALAASGLLVKKIGGRSVRPYQPDGIWESVGLGLGEPHPLQPHHGRGPLPPQHVHVLETHGPAAVAGSVQRPEPRDVHRSPRADQHAAASARVDERSAIRRSGADARAERS